jgi:hypothetical protein
LGFVSVLVRYVPNEGLAYRLGYLSTVPATLQAGGSEKKECVPKWWATVPGTKLGLDEAAALDFFAAEPEAARFCMVEGLAAGRVAREHYGEGHGGATGNAAWAGRVPAEEIVPLRG